MPAPKAAALTYDVAQAAELIGCSERKVRDLVYAGHLARVPHVGKRILIPKAEVQRLIDSATTTPAEVGA